MWLVWVIAGLCLIVVEVMSLDLVLVMLGVAALAAGAAAGMGANLWVQVIVFTVVAALLLAALRPWLLVHLRQRQTLTETNVYAQVGKPAVAVTRVGVDGGRVKLQGEVWSARLATDGAPVPPGTEMTVVAIDGATAVVAPGAPMPGASVPPTERSDR